MTPMEFIGRYGSPIVRTVELTIPLTHLIPKSDYRYLLMVISSGSDLTMSPVQGGDSTFNGFTIGVNAEKTLTHTLHGAAVNIAWLITATGATTFTYLEGMMFDLIEPKPRILESNGRVDPQLIRRIREINQSRRV